MIRRILFALHFRFYGDSSSDSCIRTITSAELVRLTSILPQVECVSSSSYNNHISPIRGDNKCDF